MSDTPKPPKPPEQSKEQPKSRLHPLLVRIEKEARAMNQGADPAPLETAALARAEADLQGVLATLQRASIITRGQVDAVLRTDALRTRPFAVNPEQRIALQHFTQFPGGVSAFSQQFLGKFPRSAEREHQDQNVQFGSHSVPQDALVLTVTPMVPKLGGGVKKFAVCYHTTFEDYTLVPLQEDGKTEIFGMNSNTLFVLRSDVFGREDGSH